MGHGEEAPVGEDAAEVAAFVMRALAAGAMICVDMFHVYLFTVFTSLSATARSAEPCGKATLQERSASGKKQT